MTPKNPQKPKPCPICGEAFSPRYKPFCSERCRLRDLAHWIGGDEPYVIAGEPMAPVGAAMSEEDLAILAEELGEDVIPGGKVIHADFRRGKRQSGDDEEF